MGPPSPSLVVMNRDQVWEAIDAQRMTVADLLEGLSADDWQQPSLCAGWTIRDVAAHLTLQQIGPGSAIAMMIRWRGSLEQTIHDTACRRASALPTGRIIAEIRATAGSRRHSIGVSYLETLTDILVHGQDIAIPLDRSLTMPPRAAAVAASRVLSMRWPPPLPAAGKVAGFRLTATDTSWAAGEGPEVQGPMGALLLVCAGRLAALPQLAGPGAPALAARLDGPQPV
jgi:uncharacterized protein (TIGR03083 family)